MSTNKAVTYIGPGKVEVREIPYPKLELAGRTRYSPGEHRT